MKLKVCGMTYQDNIKAVSQLEPDYLGFICYERSSRFFNGIIPTLPKDIKRVGVFVDASIDFVISKIRSHQLDLVQLHGNETADYCQRLKQHYSEEKLKDSKLKNKIKALEIIKVFCIDSTFDFTVLSAFENVCDYFLFDTKGILPGGNGFAFDWEILKNYPSTKPFFLSGGIGLESVDQIQTILSTEVSKYCHAIDVNSKFEIKPGLKNIEELKEFKKMMSFRT